MVARLKRSAAAIRPGRAPGDRSRPVLRTPCGPVRSRCGRGRGSAAPKRSARRSPGGSLQRHACVKESADRFLGAPAACGPTRSAEVRGGRRCAASRRPSLSGSSWPARSGRGPARAQQFARRLFLVRCEHRAEVDSTTSNEASATGSASASPSTNRRGGLPRPPALVPAQAGPRRSRRRSRRRVVARQRWPYCRSRWRHPGRARRPASRRHRTAAR